MANYDAQKNSLVEIALVSWCLGCLAGGSVIALASGRNVKLLIYMLLLVTNFMTEFISSAYNQPSRVHLRCFLIYGNPGSLHFWGMHCFMWLDNWLGYLQVPKYMRNFGVLLALCGLVIRALAMHTCGESFAHIIDTKKSARLKLVTTGIYRWSRHPSYLGYWCFAVGTLLVMGGATSMIATVVILCVFFRNRIRFEEYYLVKMYGEEYAIYRSKVRTFIPGLYL